MRTPTEIVCGIPRPRYPEVQRLRSLSLATQTRIQRGMSIGRVIGSVDTCASVVLSCTVATILSESTGELVDMQSLVKSPFARPR